MNVLFQMETNPEPNMIKILLITSILCSMLQNIYSLFLLYFHIITYILFPYYSFALMFQVHINI